MQKILFIGPISPPTSGPGIKNQEIKEWIEASDFKNSVKFLNTYDYRKLKVSLIFTGIARFLFTKRIILSVSKNGRFALIPLCYLFRKKVVLLPAGGSFDEEIESLSNWRRKIFLKASDCIVTIHVESDILLKGLKKIGFSNILKFPNPRKNRHFQSLIRGGDNFNIIFISKIRERKGVLFLIEAVDDLIKNGYKSIALNIYGIIEDDFRAAFEKGIEGKPYISYKGEISNQDVQKTIAEHHLFVLPTIYSGEGLPGALVEASFTGIPCVVSDFRAVHEVLVDEESGLIVPMGDVEALRKAIEKLHDDSNLRVFLGENLKAKSNEYDIDVLMDNFLLECRDTGFLN